MVRLQEQGLEQENSTLFFAFQVIRERNISK